MKTNFSFEGAPHRPLARVKWSKHLQGDVASTGNSPMHKVLEGLRTFGGRGYTSPKREHWEAVCERYGEGPAPRKPGNHVSGAGRKPTLAIEQLLQMARR